MYEFTLYVVGQRRRSIKAIEDLKALLEADYKGRYSLKIVSITKNMTGWTRKLLHCLLNLKGMCLWAALEKE